jgi:hypothetical protein
MHPLAKRIALLVSLFSLVVGLFLLGYNMRIISQGTMTIVLNFWPLLLIAAGFVLLFDSTKKRMFAHATGITTSNFPLPLDAGSSELSCRVQFSYGRLVAEKALGEARLVTEQPGPAAAPAITREVMGDRSAISIAVSQPLFPSQSMNSNTWRLELPAKLPLRLTLALHEAELRMDLRDLDVESLDLRLESGRQEVLLGRPSRKLTGLIYSSGSDVSLILPARVFAWVRLLNPFCRVDYPQGDLEKREDGSLITPQRPDSHGSIEIDVDGPIRALVLDFEDAPET